MQRLLEYIARFKYRALRLSTYVTVFNTVILITGFGWKWWYLLAFLGIVLAYLFEKKFGITGEMDVAWRSSREWQQFKKDFEEFKNK